MDPLDLLDEVIGDAEDALEQDPRAEYRLRQIIVDEVSLVDRAANKRRFLVVKNSSGEPMSATTSPEGNANSDTETETSADADQGNGGSVFALTSESKSAVAESMADVLGRVTAIAKTVQEAQEVEGADNAHVPSTVGKALTGVISAVTGILRDHVFKADSRQVVEALVKVSEMSMMLAEEVATDESGEVSAEVLARMSQMSELLKALSSRDDAEEESEESEEAAEESEESSEEEGGDEAEKRLVASEKRIAELEDQVKSLLAGNVAGDAPAQGADEARLSRLEDLLVGIASQLKSSDTDESAESEEADDDSDNAVAKRLAEIEKDNKALRAKLDKALEEPPTRGSSSNPVSKGDSVSSKVFPMTYNHPIHDPRAGS